jgi:glyoxylase-like metal-dependent hydrolase (beta-lactamase superfamily II)
MRKIILAAALATLGIAGGVHAEEFGPAAVAPAAHPFRIGDLHLWTLSDAQFVVANDGKTFGVDAGPDAVAQVLQAADAPTDRITLSVDVLLLRVGKLVILFDTGLGAAHHGVLSQSLQQAGVAPEDVTDVLITHPHQDHIGGLVTARETPAFPDAVVRMTPAAWASLQRQFPRLGKAIAQQVHTFEPGTVIVPDVVQSVPLAGHTPGHTGYEIISGRTRLLDIGDIAHSSIVSLAKPEWTVTFDEDKRAAKATRLKKLKELARSHERVFAPHFPFPGTGRIMTEDEGFAWKPDNP